MCLISAALRFARSDVRKERLNNWILVKWSVRLAGQKGGGKIKTYGIVMRMQLPYLLWRVIFFDRCGNFCFSLRAHCSSWQLFILYASEFWWVWSHLEERLFFFPLEFFFFLFQFHQDQFVLRRVFALPRFSPAGKHSRETVIKSSWLRAKGSRRPSRPAEGPQLLALLVEVVAEGR